MLLHKYEGERTFNENRILNVIYVSVCINAFQHWDLENFDIFSNTCTPNTLNYLTITL